MIQSRILAGAAAGLLVAMTGCGAFTTLAPRTTTTSPPPATGARRHVVAPLLAATSSSSSSEVVVISPPGGTGEIASISAARLGGSVKWFVVSASSGSGSGGGAVSLTSETLAAIERAGGSMELAGASASDLLAPPEGEDSASNGALSAMASWLGEGGGGGGGGASRSLICTYDGAAEERRRADRGKTPEQLEKGIDEEGSIRGGIRVAAREAARAGAANKVCVLAAGEETEGGDGDGEEDKGGVGGLLAGLFGGNDVKVPDSLAEAVGGATAVIRHGELFGAAESSPESSPFAGGPRRDPVVREMYSLRAVRVDPSASASDFKTNRLAVGEAASRLGLGRIAPARGARGSPLDVSLSSFAGSDPPADEEWDAEFARAIEAIASSSSSGTGGATLFRAEFSSVPSPRRLAEWLAVKWAPAVLRSYDIAGTRVGARPVYALQGGEDGTRVEIVWQELANFESVTSGRMIVEVSEGGMTATRGAGDASQGFGSVSRTPLPGEDVLVRRLADAASQAVEKGLAAKPQVAKKKAAARAPVTTVAAVETVPARPDAASAPPGGASGPGPRGAGARRSAERSRGGRRRKGADGGPPPSPQ